MKVINEVKYYQTFRDPLSRDKCGKVLVMDVNGGADPWHPEVGISIDGQAYRVPAKQMIKAIENASNHTTA